MCNFTNNLLKYNKVLEKINNPSDLKKYAIHELPTVADEIHSFLKSLSNVKTDHLISSLCVTELTISLHYVLNTPDDILIWDVGHQSYVHKLLTERKNQFNSLRVYKGLSGFPKRTESPYDPFGTGHSSTSISATLGMAEASKLKEEINKQHVCVIGDASLAGGISLEALGNGGVSDTNILIILNDNNIGLDPTVGAFKNHFQNINPNDNIFTHLGYDYTGPIDGHDISLLINTLNFLLKKDGPKVLHIRTKKNPLKATPTPPSGYTKFQDVFGLTLSELAQTNEKIVGITAAMPSGTSMKHLSETFPKRVFDVGICEQHAVTFAAGLATQGYLPFFAVYSTFLQRAFDQIIHDVALQNLPVIFCIDRADLVGEDGPTHHGVFDLSFLRMVPNITILSPMDEVELRNILYTVQKESLKGPIAIRYPRGNGVIKNWRQPFKIVSLKKNKILRPSGNTAICSIGFEGNKVENLLNKDKFNDEVAHYNITCSKPLDEDFLHTLFKNHAKIITIEANSCIGGIGNALADFKNIYNYTNQLQCLGVPDRFIPHGNITELEKEIGIDKEYIESLL